MAEKEYIEREAAIDLLHYHTDETCSAVVSDFEAIPAADVVEVVRCEDCKDYEPHGNGKAGICRNPKCKGLRWANDFCSFGERRGKT